MINFDYRRFHFVRYVFCFQYIFFMMIIVLLRVYPVQELSFSGIILFRNYSIQNESFSGIILFRNYFLQNDSFSGRILIRKFPSQERPLSGIFLLGNNPFQDLFFLGNMIPWLPFAGLQFNICLVLLKVSKKIKFWKSYISFDPLQELFRKFR